MKRQFVVSDELQQFLIGLPSPALNNVIWDAQIPSDPLVIPTNPETVRRMLAYDKVGSDGGATPVIEYNCWLHSLDGTLDQQITFPRAI